MLGRRGFGRHGQEGAPVVAVWGAVRSSSAPVVPGVVGGAVAAVPGFFSHRSTGYQRISASGRWLPATLRARPDTQVGRSPFPHAVVTRSADPGCPERHTDHLRASYPARTFAAEPARRHGTTPRPSAPEQRELVSSLSNNCRSGHRVWLHGRTAALLHRSTRHGTQDRHPRHTFPDTHP
ncbi:hypothetical protein SLI_2081 [Streptomyces lividans 1326]|uniref:Uncharacterized protein n=1 Tax=Streptomyces lividans 1326 TaxID=1200984 RepID=A0A7U9HBK7_STRLI|nr:hypothetical protein SLI_2081 [Streptomyces lividans 1326]